MYCLVTCCLYNYFFFVHHRVFQIAKTAKKVATENSETDTDHDSTIVFCNELSDVGHSDLKNSTKTSIYPTEDILLTSNFSKVKVKVNQRSSEHESSESIKLT